MFRLTHYVSFCVVFVLIDTLSEEYCHFQAVSRPTTSGERDLHLFSPFKARVTRFCVFHINLLRFVQNRRWIAGFLQHLNDLRRKCNKNNQTSLKSAPRRQNTRYWWRFCKAWTNDICFKGLLDDMRLQTRCFVHIRWTVGESPRFWISCADLWRLLCIAPFSHSFGRMLGISNTTFMIVGWSPWSVKSLVNRATFATLAARHKQWLLHADEHNKTSLCAQHAAIKGC